ncbi:MAG: leucine-rich repeat domain-containing protein [Oscillospiraceae bacterium]|nr:leucine-rich repeat domain-containing protein [Oscillospiraceae bacterium]
MKSGTKKIVVAVCLAVIITGSYFLIKPHGFVRYVTDSAFEYTESGGGLILTKYTGGEENLIVPSNIDGKPVLALEGTFCANISLKNVRISEGVLSVDYMAFWHCVSLESVELPDSLETVGHAAFDKCISLKKVTVGKNLTYIMPYAFSGCLSLESFTLPQGLRFIGENAFENCSGLRNIYIPESVEIIGGVTGEKTNNADENEKAYDEQKGSVKRQSFSGCGDLKIEISEENPYYQVSDGKIMSKKAEK